MKQITLDCIGLPCPQPVLRVKDALQQGAERIDILVDNEASKNNVIRFATSQGHQVESRSGSEGGFVVAITATASPSGQAAPNDVYRCATISPIRMVYVIASDSMGRGSDELGWALLQTFIQTIGEVDPLPEKIIFYNSGVKLVTAASGALEALKQLQARGVEILACGTCLDFFKLKSAIQVGQISNMYAIMRSMADADKIVSPY